VLPLWRLHSPRIGSLGDRLGTKGFQLGARNGVFWSYNEHRQAITSQEAIIPRRFWPGQEESWEDYGAGIIF